MRPRSSPSASFEALRWDADVEEQFFRSRARELPRVTYDESLGFDPEAKIRELDEILKDASRELGEKDRLGAILRATADEYREVVRMLVARGTQTFYTKSRKLYGSPKDKLPDGKTTVRDMGFELYDVLTSIGGERLGPAQQRDISAETAAIELNARFDRFFGGASIQVQVDDSLLADAAAGSDYVKIRSGAKFSRQDIDILEAHEGWVHVATSRNWPVLSPSRAGSPKARRARPPCKRRLAAPRRDLHLPLRPPRRAKKSTTESSPSTRPRTARRSSTCSSGIAPRATKKRSASSTRAASSKSRRLRRRRRALHEGRLLPARASSSTTRSCARRFSVIARTSSRSSSSARSPTRTCRCSTRT